MLNTNGNYYVNRLRRRESFKRLINIGLSAICLFLEIACLLHVAVPLPVPAGRSLQKIWYAASAGERHLQRDLIFSP